MRKSAKKRIASGLPFFPVSYYAKIFGIKVVKINRVLSLLKVQICKGVKLKRGVFLMNSFTVMSMLGVLASNTGANNSSSGTWDVSSLLANGAATLRGWGSYIIIILGIVALIAAAYMIVTGLISHGKKQTSWAVAIILVIVGGMLFAGGWGMWVDNISNTGKETIEKLATTDAGNPKFIDGGSQLKTGED